MRAFRIADRRFPIFDGTGARLVGGRWNTPGRPVIYTSETFAGSLLEILVHANIGRAPKTHVAIEISIPNSVKIETVSDSTIPGWDAEDFIASRAYGDQWLIEKRSAVLKIPSAVTRGREHNFLINPEHPAFNRITAGKPEPVQWDHRFFRNR